MQCTLLIPRLFGPRDAAALDASLPLPALEKLLGRARCERLPAMSYEAWLCGRYGVERQQDWPVAPLMLERDGGAPGSSYWLRADPVHLRVQRDGLVLVDNALFDIDAGEAQALIAALNAHFAPEGIAFHAPVPRRWYAALARVPRLATRSTAEVAGGDVQRSLPEGEDALVWHRIFNEVQMLLHDHPVNEAREARGEVRVNSVWFCGGGTRSTVACRPYDAVWSDEAVAPALAGAVGTPAESVPADCATWLARAAERVSHLIVLTEAGRAAAYRDTQAWRSRVEALEARWLVPLQRALRERRIARLTLAVTGGGDTLVFEARGMDLLKLWRRRRPWSDFT